MNLDLSSLTIVTVLTANCKRERADVKHGSHANSILEFRLKATK